MKYTFIVLLFVLTGWGLSAQQLAPSVLASSGSHGQAGNYSLDWTLGEATVSTSRSGDFILTQGFHQPELLVIIGSIDVDLDVEVRAFPNPVLSGINISTEETGLGYSVIDEKGQRCMGVKPLSAGGQFIDLTLAPKGMLFIHVWRKDRMIKVIKVEKL